VMKREFGRVFAGYTLEHLKRFVDEALEDASREGLKNARVGVGPFGRLYWYGETDDDFIIPGWDLK